MHISMVLPARDGEQWSRSHHGRIVHDSPKQGETYLLLELLVDCVQRIFDGHALEVSSRYLKPEGPLQVDLFYRRRY